MKKKKFMSWCDPGLCVYALDLTFVFVLIIALKELEGLKLHLSELVIT